MRFTRVWATSTDELKRALIEEIDALMPGCRLLAADLETPAMGRIDRLAVAPDGRLALLVVDQEVGTETIARAVGQADWLLRNLPLVLALGSRERIDPSAAPTCTIVGGRVSDAARRLAGALPHLRVELLAAGLIVTGATRGVLIEPVETFSLASPVDDRDSLLDALPPGEPRSMARRIIEELRHQTEGAGVTTAPLKGGVLFLHDGRPSALLAPGESGLCLLRFSAGEDRIADRLLEGDTGCRRAVADILGSAGVARTAEPGRSPATMPLQAAPPAVAPGASALTAEEIAEFERLAGPQSAPARPDSRRAPAEAQAVKVLRPYLVEN